MPEQFPHFVRIDRDGWKAEAHHVVHAHQPRFTLELTPGPEAPDRIGRGIIRRICVPNSRAGDFGRCDRLLQAAQEFSRRPIRRVVGQAGGASRPAVAKARADRPDEPCSISLSSHPKRLIRRIRPTYPLKPAAARATTCR